MAKHIRRVRGRPPTDFANQSQVTERDAAALSSPTGREEGRAEDEAESDFQAEVQAHEAGAQPASEITADHKVARLTKTRTVSTKSSAPCAMPRKRRSDEKRLGSSFALSLFNPEAA
jgi:hypothetical protein